MKDKEQFELIYTIYFEKVYRYLLQLSKDSYLAEDLTSETFLRAMKNISSFRGESKLSSWLCAIGKNLYFSHLKKEENHLRPDSDFAGGIEPDKILLQKEQQSELYQMLHELPEPYREVFSLRFFGELSFREIGTLFEHSENWACVTYYRARMKIQERMKKNGL